MEAVCPWCGANAVVWVGSHLQCDECKQVIDGCCEGLPPSE